MEDKNLFKKSQEDAITIRELKEVLNQIDESELDLPVYVYSYDEELKASQIEMCKCGFDGIYGMCISGYDRI